MKLDYELSAASSTSIVAASEGQKETYDLTQLPSETSLVVKHAIDELYGRIDPVTLYTNLSICADLFEITYYAVNGIEGMQAAVWDLRQSLNKTAIDSADDYVRRFLNSCKKIPGYYKIAVKALLSDPVNSKQALKVFALISDEARKISEGAKELVDCYKKLTDDASGIVTKMIEKKAEDTAERKKLEANMEVIKAKMDGLKAIQKDLDADIEELTEQYKRLDKKIDSASKRQFALSMTSAVFGAIGTGLSAYTSSSAAGVAKSISKDVTGTISSDQQNKTIANTQERLAESQKQVADLEKQISDKKKALEEKNKQISAETDEDKKAVLLKEKETLTQEIDQAEASKKSKEAESKSYTDTINGLSAGFSSLSSSLDKQASQTADAVTALTNLADKVFEQRAALRKQKREILGQVAEYTKTIENSVVSKNSMELAIAAISAGISALNYVVSVLNDFYQFWLSIKVQTANMAEGEIESYIEIYEDMPEELRSLDFYMVLLKNAAQWVALGCVLTEYQNAFYRVSDKLQAQLKVREEANQEVAWKKAIELSKGMSNLIAIQQSGI